MATVDVKKAFLKGITYAELAELTNEPAREVNFELGADAARILRQCKGYHDFDPLTEVLHMNKPGTGCKDAPRCFAIKLAWATNNSFGANPLLHDEQLIVRHKGGELDFSATKHVDDTPTEFSTNLLPVSKRRLAKASSRLLDAILLIAEFATKTCQMGTLWIRKNIFLPSSPSTAPSSPAWPVTN